MNKKAIGDAIFFKIFSNLPKKLQMARPVKEGLEYFPVDATIFNDRKIKKLIKNYGCKGLSVYLCLLCEIYRDKGYYVEYSGDVLIDVASNLDAVSENLVDEVIKACLSYGLFNNDVFVACIILTSKGIQERYQNIKRTAKLKDEFRVIEEKPIVITEKPPITPQEPQVIDETIPQSKVKESKVYIVIDNEQKFLDWISEMFDADVGLLYLWRGKGFDEKKFLHGVEVWAARNHSKKYNSLSDARDHFQNWMPNYHKAASEIKEKNNVTSNNTATVRKLSKHEAGIAGALNDLKDDLNQRGIPNL